MRIGALVVAMIVTSNAAAEDQPNFIPLFNGKNLDGWKERQVRKGQEGRWSVEDGILKAKIGRAHV